MRLFPLIAILAMAPLATGQTFGDLQQDARPFVPSLEARAMGGAVAAVPQAQTAFFYNPAHLARADRRFRLTVLGVGAGVSSNVQDAYAFWRDDLEPALEEGLEEIRDTDYDRLEALYDEALDLGRQPTVSRVAVYGPSFSLPVGPGRVAGLGLFGTNTTRLQFSNAGAGIPYVDAYSQADVIVPVVAALTIPGAPVPLAVGATAAYTRRYLTAKSALIESIDADREQLYVLSGSTVALDVGVHAQDVGVTGLDIGGAVYSLIGGGFDYRYDRSIDVSTNNGGVEDAAEIAALEARFNERSAAPSVRLGAAYRLPLPRDVTPLDVTLSTDYVSRSTSQYSQAFGSHLRLGALVGVGKNLAVRAGFSQGQPSIGGSLMMPNVIRIDYAYFGVEDGRTTGQLSRMNHALQVRFGRF